MKNKILHSIIKITQHRDLDSLEYSLIATLAELVPVTNISLYKTPRDNTPDAVDRVLQLKINDYDTPHQSIEWGDIEYSLPLDSQLKACLEKQCAVEYIHDGSLNRLLIPIVADDNVMSILSVSSYHNFSSFRSLIEGFIKIYTNYIIILNESERDKLTGLYNRRTFDNKLLKLFSSQNCMSANLLSTQAPVNRRSFPSDQTAWLVIFDIDNFKKVNDQYGHVFGDEVILSISQIMKLSFRSSDLMFRIGGEEFVIIIEPTSFEVATTLVEGLRQSIADHVFPQVGSVTISCGYARITEKDYPPTILDRADNALYYAKDNGRNLSFNYEKLIEQGLLKLPKINGSIDLF